MANLTEGQTIQNDLSDSASNNTFGVISLLTSSDTAASIEFPMQKGKTTLELSPDDFSDTIDSNLDSSIEKTVKSQTPSETVSTTETVQKVEEEIPASKNSFTEFDEKVFRINYTKIGDIENGWIFWVLLGSLIIFGITKLIFPKRMESVFSVAFNFNSAQKKFEKTKENPQHSNKIIQCLYTLNLGLFSFFAFKYNLDWDFATLRSMTITAMLSFFILGLYLIKYFCFLVFAKIFDRIHYARECIFNTNLFNRTLCLCLYPLLIALAFVKPTIISTNTLLNLGYILIIVFYIFTILREIQISLKNKISLFYIFLYFCTLEILPLMILVKVFTSIVFAEISSL